MAINERSALEHALNPHEAKQGLAAQQVQGLGLLCLAICGFVYTEMQASGYLAQADANPKVRNAYSLLFAIVWCAMIQRFTKPSEQADPSAIAAR